MSESTYVLIIEDTVSLALTFAGQLEAAGCTVEMADSGAEARQQLTRSPRPFDVILLDLNLPDGDGLELLESTPQMARDTSVVVITADGSISRAIQAMRSGAYDFLVKPVAPERLTTTVVRAGQHRMLEREVQVARRIKKRDRFQGFVGGSDAMQVVYRAIENVANSRATVFVTGESGTGKEVTAEAIHAISQRSKGRFVAINCGAIPENLLESELFGHVKGAFTGALDNRVGAAKEADGGTLFLDEICEMELKLQVKLLRFLQTGMIQRVGSCRPEAVNVRVVCATNRDPAAEVQAGRFREDLFYRLSVLPIELPPLRERGDDVVLLAQAFLDRFAAEEGKAFDPLDAAAVDQLRRYAWPGNVRELQNTMRRAVVMNPGPALSLAPLLPREASPVPQATPASPGGLGAVPSAAPPLDGPSVDPEAAFDGMTLAQIERRVIERAISLNHGSVPGAARALAVSPSTLYRKLERWSSEATVDG
ncbi:Regulatory protein LuxO [Halomonas sp. THAF5a]|uniref:sigma-54-dependent transcriptional regulator n=1 Tax=Halomonas sp. THAF5a TaxID=2587844 RepID=UPI0012A91F0D|nr:sigma-54 dependent transcriptional regulator [Halomonas sp. THAF5a]QFU00715.1 Regulatory protein LuxO [Halomonas sp. THAF5a]